MWPTSHTTITPTIGSRVPYDSFDYRQRKIIQGGQGIHNA